MVHVDGFVGLLLLFLFLAYHIFVVVALFRITSDIKRENGDVRYELKYTLSKKLEEQEKQIKELKQIIKEK